MPSARLAEWLLSLFATRDVAASIVGDLIEESREHGSWWFWPHAIRTTMAFCGREIACRPGRFLALVFFGIVSYEHALLLTDVTWVSRWSWIVRVILIGRLVAPFLLGLLASLVAESAIIGCLTVAVIRSSLIVLQWHDKPVPWLALTAVLPAFPIIAAGVLVRRRLAA
jgi:hypothetical protein